MIITIKVDGRGYKREKRDAMLKGINIINETHYGHYRLSLGIWPEG
jgi:hypothetical protein